MIFERTFVRQVYNSVAKVLISSFLVLELKGQHNIRNDNIRSKGFCFGNLHPRRSRYTQFSQLPSFASFEIREVLKKEIKLNLNILNTTIEFVENMIQSIICMSKVLIVSLQLRFYFRAIGSSSASKSCFRLWKPNF